MKRPTIVDVAKAAGVSKSTVSLVLQNSALVRESTKASVREAIAEIGYVYNRAAANLRGPASGLIGLVINDLRNPFFTEFAASAQMAFARRGFATVLANTDEDPGMQAQVIGSMIEHGVTGLIVSPAYGDAAALDPLARAGIPTIQVLRQVDPRTDLFPVATFDHASGGQRATEHLIAEGCRGIAFVGGIADTPVTQDRMSGYLQALERAGLTPLHLPGRPSRAFGRCAAWDLLRDRPDITAALCFNDLVALGMHAGFAEAGVELGAAFRLVGFDDIEDCALVWPQLSSVRCGVARFGEAMAGALLDWIVEDDRPPQVSRAPVELVVRQSSGRVT